MGWGGSAVSIRELTQKAHDYFSMCFYVAMFFDLAGEQNVRTGIAGNLRGTTFFQNRNKGARLFPFLV